MGGRSDIFSGGMRHKRTGCCYHLDPDMAQEETPFPVARGQRAFRHKTAVETDTHRRVSPRNSKNVLTIAGGATGILGESGTEKKTHQPRG